MALPFLPGNTFNRKLGCENFHKPQHFNFSLDEPMLAQGKPGIGGENIIGTKQKRDNIFSNNYDFQIPSWIAFDKKVLSFDTWYKESVVESRLEKYRIRYCKLYFYLEDSTIQVIEPRLKNSGLPQGNLIKRHRILRDPADESSYWTVEDLNLSMNMEMYGKIFRLINCDQFTRNFLYKIGIKLNESEQLPQDPYNEHRSSVDGQMQPLKPYQVIDTLGQFLTHDTQVLRFRCYWDDSESHCGDFRDLILHYYLSDDTIEIIEMYPKNSGRDKTPLFLKRDKLPKNLDKLPKHGQVTKRTVLNVFGPIGVGSRSILDTLRTGEYQVEFYKDSDLKIGNSLNIYGREVVLVSCDEFTQQYYSQIYGIVDFEPIEYKIPKQAGKPKKYPPYTGYGTEEDSLVSCLMMELKPPFKDLTKFLEYGGCGYISNVLRFTANICSDKPIDCERHFVVSYFLSDDTFLIFENSMNNSGFTQGKFMERQKVRLPDQSRYNTQMSKHYSISDLYIGNVLKINSFNFVLSNADEHAFNYMETNSNQFPFSNFALIQEKIRSKINDEIKNNLQGVPVDENKCLDYDQFREIMAQTFPCLVLQEIMTVARKYSIEPDNGLSTDYIIQITLESLKKSLWNEFREMFLLLEHSDVERTGLLTLQQTSNALKSIKLPIHFDLLKMLLGRFTDENQKIDYKQLVDTLNWRQSYTNVTQPLEGGSNHVTMVNYSQFYEDCIVNSSN